MIVTARTRYSYLLTYNPRALSAFDLVFPSGQDPSPDFSSSHHAAAARWCPANECTYLPQEKDRQVRGREHSTKL